MTNKNKNKNKNKIFEENNEEYIYKELDDNKINYFPDGIINEFITGMSILKYKMAIYWIPVILFAIIMFILVHTVFEASVFDGNILKTELMGSVLAAVVMFICYFLVDFIFQLQLCKDQEIGEDVINSVFNALHITIVVTFGYIFAIFLNDSIVNDIELAKLDFDKMVRNNAVDTGVTRASLSSVASTNNLGINLSNDSVTEMYNRQETVQAGQQNLLKMMLTSSQNNNILMGMLFYFIGMAYWNPYYDHKCSRNKICTKKKVKK